MALESSSAIISPVENTVQWAKEHKAEFWIVPQITEKAWVIATICKTIACSFVRADRSKVEQCLDA